MKEKKQLFFNNHKKWLISSATLLTLAIIYQQYSQEIICDPSFDYALKNAELAQSLETKLVMIRDNSFFLAWFKTYNIALDDELDYSEKIIQDEIFKTRQAIEEVLTEDSFFPNLMNENFISIAFLRDKIIGRSRGAYSPTDHLIGLKFIPGTSVAEYKRVFRNELFSNQVQVRNELNGINVKDQKIACTLALNSDATINKKRLTQFQQAITSGKNRIETCIENFTSGNTNDCYCKELLKLSEKYTPAEYYFTTAEFEKSVASGFTTPLNKENKFYMRDQTTGLPSFFGQKKNDRFVFTYAKDATRFSKAVALLEDILWRFSGVESELTPYAKLDKANKVSEYGSFIAELPQDIQKYLFPEFYKLMVKFFTTETIAPQHDIKIHHTEKTTAVHKNKNTFFNDPASNKADKTPNKKLQNLQNTHQRRQQNSR